MTIEETQTEFEREINKRAYIEMEEELLTKYTGKWVVIAQGKLLKVGKSIEDVEDVAPDAHHRFIFRVEKAESRKGTFRLPMRRVSP